MSENGDDIDELAFPEPAGLDEPSQGADDLGELVEDRPELPETDWRRNTQQMRLPENIKLDGEHLFGACPLFEHLSPEEIREVVGASVKQPIHTGDLLFEQGAEATALYIVQSGEVQVRAHSPSGEDIVLAVLGPGAVVGELALIDGGPRSATVEAISDCDVYRLERVAFNELRAQRRPAAYKVIMGLAVTVDERRRQSERRISEVFDDPAQHIELFASQVHEMLARLKKV